MNRSLTLARPSVAIAAAVVAVGLLASCSSNAAGDGTVAATSPTTTSAAQASGDQSSAAQSSAAQSSAAQSSAAQASGDQSSAASSPAAQAAGAAGDNDAAITDTARAYLAALSSGKVAQLSGVLCKKLVDTIPPGTTDSPAQPQPLILDKISNLVVDGDTATAEVTANLQGGSEVGPQTTTVKFVNENGWKACE